LADLQEQTVLLYFFFAREVIIYSLDLSVCLPVCLSVSSVT